MRDKLQSQIEYRAMGGAQPLHRWLSLDREGPQRMTRPSDPSTARMVQLMSQLAPQEGTT
uniref:Uncharacterized protein n=1 Tax=Ectopseudomonas oleovorans TaxID=301 RepID=A0A653BCZ9_ECTOL